MPLFQCAQCGCVENTALGDFWWRRDHDKLPPLCSGCSPTIGKWHGQFPQEQPGDSYYTDAEGFLQETTDGSRATQRHEAEVIALAEIKRERRQDRNRRKRNRK